MVAEMGALQLPADRLNVGVKQSLLALHVSQVEGRSEAFVLVVVRHIVVNRASLAYVRLLAQSAGAHTNIRRVSHHSANWSSLRRLFVQSYELLTLVGVVDLDRSSLGSRPWVFRHSLPFYR